MRGLTIILGFHFTGYLLHQWFVPLPGSVLGMILLAASLFLGWVKLGWIEDAAQLLLQHMMLFFTPIIVGVVLIFPRFESQLVPLLAGLIGSTVVVMLVTGWSIQVLRPEKSSDSHGAAKEQGGTASWK